MAKGGSRAYCGKEWCHYAAECKKFHHYQLSRLRVTSVTTAYLEQRLGNARDALNPRNVQRRLAFLKRHVRSSTIF